jgi:hypothetical protein
MIFTPKVQEILNFDYFLSLKIQLKFNQLGKEYMLGPMAHATTSYVM